MIFFIKKVKNWLLTFLYRPHLMSPSSALPSMVFGGSGEKSNRSSKFTVPRSILLVSMSAQGHTQMIHLRRILSTWAPWQWSPNVWSRLVSMWCKMSILSLLSLMFQISLDVFTTASLLYCCSRLVRNKVYTSRRSCDLNTGLWLVQSSDTELSLVSSSPGSFSRSQAHICHV